MTEEERKEAEERADAERKKADAEAGEKLDKALAALDSMAKRMDKLEMRDMRKDEEGKEEREDSEKEESKAKKADGEEEDKEEIGRHVEGVKHEAKELEGKDSKKKKDSEEKEEKREDATETIRYLGKQGAKRHDEMEMEDSKRKDADKEREELADSMSSIAKKIARVEAQLPKHMSDADFAALAYAQARADSIFQAFGKHAPRPMSSEDLPGYRRRVANMLKEHSPSLKNANIYAIADDASFEHIEKTIYADSMAAAMSPQDLEEGTLREIKSRDITGREISTFVGSPSAWMGGLTGYRQRARFNTQITSGQR